MTILADPTSSIATAPYPAEPAPPARRPTSTTGAASRRSPPTDPAASTEQLLRQLHDLPVGHRDRTDLRARAIVTSLPMANRLARRYAGRGEPFDDLVQVAAVALIRAVDGYDPARQTPFAGYAYPTILGALKKHFRDTTWGVRIPRSLLDLAARVGTATTELNQSQGRPPTPAELAEHLQANVDDVRAAIATARVYHLVSLNAPPPGTDNAERIDLIGGTDTGYTNVDDHQSVQLLLAVLPVRERRIITMRFYDQLSQTQIGAEVGLCQMQISRLLRQSLARLRAALPD